MGRRAWWATILGPQRVGRNRAHIQRQSAQCIAEPLLYESAVGEKGRTAEINKTQQGLRI